MLAYLLEGIVGIVLFAGLYLIGKVLLRDGGGDESHDIGLD